LTFDCRASRGAHLIRLKQDAVQVRPPGNRSDPTVVDKSKVEDKAEGDRARREHAGIV
jgi:hypothetical protein